MSLSLLDVGWTAPKWASSRPRILMIVGADSLKRVTGDPFLKGDSVTVALGSGVSPRALDTEAAVGQAETDAPKRS